MMDNLAEIGSSSADIRRAAMNKLARREHSYKELDQKLSQRFPENALRRSVLDKLISDDLLSDERFAVNYCRYRSGRGYGPDRIGMELGQKGVCDVVIEDVLAVSEIDWMALLEQLYDKKFQSVPPQSLEERAKYTRFFLYRGFKHGQIRSLFN